MTLEIHRLLAENLTPEEALRSQLPALQECFVHPLPGRPSLTPADARLALASLLGCGSSSSEVRMWEIETVAHSGLEVCRAVSGSYTEAPANPSPSRTSSYG